MSDQATYFGANGWLLELAGRRILVDPWLVDRLVFPPGPWLFCGELPRPWPVPADLDLLLLTQGLPDHCHPPTLALLDLDLPVVASASGAARAREQGFRQVTALRPGEHTQLAGAALEIQALPGAPVPLVENGYLLRGGGTSLYLEPHGYLAAEAQLPPQAVDVVISPVVDLGLPLAGAFVRGQSVLPDLLRRLQPHTVLASTTGGAVTYSGALSRLLWQKGNLAEAQRQVEALAPDCRLIDPQPGVAIPLEHRSPVTAL